MMEDDMAGGLDQSLEAFLDRLSKRAPTPGGGAATALVAATACALTRMVTAYSLRAKDPEERRAPLEALARDLATLDRTLRTLIDEDIRAYRTMTEARKSASGPDLQRDAAYQDAVLQAIDVPLAIAAASCEALFLLETHMSSLNRHLLSDLGAAVEMAQSAVQAARYFVWANRAELGDQDQARSYLHRMDGFAQECDERARRLREQVQKTLLDSE